MKANESDHFSYENALAALQNKVQQLEAGELGFEAALQVFEEANAIAAQCQDFLEKAELRVQQIAEGSPEA